MYGIPVEAEAFDIELNLIGSIPLEEIVTGDYWRSSNYRFKSKHGL